MTGLERSTSLHRLLQQSPSAKLAVVEVGVEAVLREQFLVGAFFDDRAVIHDQDQLRVADGGEPVGDNEAGSALHQLGHGPLNLHLGAGVDAAGRFIENQYLWI